MDNVATEEPKVKTAALFLSAYGSKPVQSTV